VVALAANRWMEKQRRILV